MQYGHMARQLQLPGSNGTKQGRLANTYGSTDEYSVDSPTQRWFHFALHFELHLTGTVFVFFFGGGEGTSTSHTQLSYPSIMVFKAADVGTDEQTPKES